ncbi:MAG: DUF3179 domain-containing protein, partial [Casimicrobiaceae bacterium]
MKPSAAVRAWLLAWGIGLAGATDAQMINGFDLHGALVPPDQILSGGPSKDGIPAIDHPRFVPGDAAKLAPGDRILGVVRSGIAKAYPVRILNWHEIVNDRFGDEPIAVTYCPLCGTGVAYRGRAGGIDTTFGVSGLLYNSDVLLYDRTSESLWSQILAQAISGPLKGQKLTPVAMTHTSWSDWRMRHPGTLVLTTDTGYVRDYSRDPYQGYESSPNVIFPVASTDERFPPKETVLGLIVSGTRKAYAFSELSRALGDKTRGVIVDRMGDTALTIRFDREHRTAQAFDRDGREIPGI